MEDLKSKIENLNITDAQINTIATKVAEKGFYTKSEIDSMIADIVVPTRIREKVKQELIKRGREDFTEEKEGK